MGDLKPLGSEKLKGDEKMKRILELTFYGSTQKKTTTNKTAETLKESVNGGVYGIVKEKDGYYVKHGLNENTLDYIGGLFMKNKNRFSSYSEALKRLDFISGQENRLNESTKYILKKKTNNQEAPVPQPTMDEPAPEPTDSAPTPEVPADDMGGEVPPSDMGGDVPTPDDESKRSDYMAEVQKYAGKLGQELRDQKERMESDDIKYVLNMIISAVDLDKLDIDDLEEIGKKFEREDEDFNSDESPEEVPSENPEEPTPSNDEPPTDEELGETMSMLDDFINSNAPKEVSDIDLSKYADIDDVNEENMDDFDDETEIDLEEIKKEINNRVSETLSKYFK